MNLALTNPAAAPAHHLSVDGMSPDGPNLSHWPGNRTPRRWKADLSTGICLNFARAPRGEQEAFLAGAEAVLNDHYDTDGFLSLLAILRPEVVRAREEQCLLAAATGDFQAFHTPRAFAVDRIVAGLAGPGSPVADTFAGLEAPARDEVRYRWLLEHAEQILDRPESLAPLYEEELATVREQLAAGRAGALERAVHPHAGLAVVHTTAPVHRLVLNTLAGAWRVLHVVDTPDGPTYRYHDRTESWFEVVSFTPPPRTDLRPLAARLAALESPEPAGPGAPASPTWHADPPTDPIPELYHGPAAPQAPGRVSRTLTPSRLTPETVEATVLAHLEDPAR